MSIALGFKTKRHADTWDWHPCYILVGMLDMVDHDGVDDTRELVAHETVERRRRFHAPSCQSYWEYRWPA